MLQEAQEGRHYEKIKEHRCYSSDDDDEEEDDEEEEDELEEDEELEEEELDDRLLLPFLAGAGLLPAGKSMPGTKGRPLSLYIEPETAPGSPVPKSG